MSPRIAIVGAGAIGGYVGAHMTKAGLDVVLIDAWPAHVEAMRERGMEVVAMQPEAEVHVPVRALHLCDATAAHPRAALRRRPDRGEIL